MKNTFKGILCLLVLVITFAFITPDVSKANTTNDISNYNANQILDVMKKYSSANPDGTVSYNLESIEKSLENNPYKSEVLKELKKVNGTNGLENLNKTYNLEIQKIGGVTACGTLYGKKENPKYYNYYNTCVKNKMIAAYGPVQAMTSFVDAIMNKSWKKGFTILVKSGIKSSFPGFLITASHAQITCLNAAQKKYKPCI
ncbi:hypothetical protein CW676_12160 [Macrococcoides caseolyticum]|uniref:hypothetical protein n=1 Tax=Macrococcoides caseolyticum TaxID=69966 RepID=UPI000C341791|nr:hypothetical protein [Macrococcus caseolyticus]PKE05702.1 hypothetical protein CW692_11980 [Macrococcus caseolyticus]PKE22904.1 hypothetical protein CW689_11985 [Macrococcus caseolyticus]PKE51806.1 hypothetical protein CW676_12160 [Macrococcus caseolyticus]PKF37408.1 hypothetical protein CW681_12225 [Macrococcus caseolyticus]